MATCCPPGSLGPAAPLSSQTPKGRMETMTCDNDSNDILPMPCYCTGAPLEEASRVVVVFTDVFGLESGNHKAVADALADLLMAKKDNKQKHMDTATAVVTPDIFRGHPIADYTSRIPVVLQLVWKMGIGFDHNSYDKDMQHLILPWIQRQLQDKLKSNIACVGFCFGGWCVARALALANESDESDDNTKSDKTKSVKSAFSMTCGVGIHPALKPEAMRQAGQALLARRMGSKPVLWLSAGNDELKPGGQHNVVTINAEARNIPEEEVAIEFPDMIHGWVTRGDSASDEKVAMEQQRALQLTADFINKHCPV